MDLTQRTAESRGLRIRSVWSAFAVVVLTCSCGVGCGEGELCYLLGIVRFGEGGIDVVVLGG